MSEIKTSRTKKKFFFFFPTGEAGGKLDDEGAGDGESGEERPVAVPLPPEEHRPWIELPHLLEISISRQDQKK